MPVGLTEQKQIPKPLLHPHIDSSQLAVAPRLARIEELLGGIELSQLVRAHDDLRGDAGCMACSCVDGG